MPRKEFCIQGEYCLRRSYSRYVALYETKRDLKKKRNLATPTSRCENQAGKKFISPERDDDMQSFFRFNDTSCSPPPPPSSAQRGVGSPRGVNPSSVDTHTHECERPIVRPKPRTKVSFSSLSVGALVSECFCRLDQKGSSSSLGERSADIAQNARSVERTDGRTSETEKRPVLARRSTRKGRRPQEASTKHTSYVFTLTYSKERGILLLLRLSFCATQSKEPKTRWTREPG